MKNKMTLTLLLFVLSIFATPVAEKIAKKVANNWFAHINDGRSSKIKEVIPTKFNGITTFYTFTYEDGGFVIIAGDDASIPVLGYSKTSEFELKTSYTNINGWFETYNKQLEEISTKKLSNVTTKSKWNDILVNKFQKKDRIVETLMETTWNQSPLYNKFCPDSAGVLPPVGCVATAMSQILRYHKYPYHGEGTHSYYSYYSSETLSADFANASYDWDNMPLALTSTSSETEIDAVATLCYHLGVSVDMGYSSTGSGAYSSDVPGVLEDYFRISPSVQIKSKYSMSATNWQNMLINEFDNARPVYYSGRGTGGHAFVCDGYDASDHFHFNWGWGGSANGYYYLDNLNPSGSNFTQAQQAVINIYPRPVDITIDPYMPDVLLTTSSKQIDLSNYFSSSNSITYSVKEIGTPTVISASISGHTLTINKLENGISTIQIKAATSSESTFDEFEVKTAEELPFAGYGNLYDFAGISYINAGNEPILNDMTKLTIEAWVKISESGNNGIISKALGTASGWYLATTTNNKLKFYVQTEAGARKNYNTTVLENDQWYHIAATYNGDRARIYINGLLDKEKIYTSFSNIVQKEEANLYIGNAGGNRMNGMIDDVRLWNKELSNTAIISEMNNYQSNGITDLVGYWKLDNLMGEAVIDETGNNTGIINNLTNANWVSSTVPLTFYVNKASSSFEGNLIGYSNYSSSVTYALENASSTLGTVSLTNANTGAFTYIPNGTEGVDSFTFSVNDGNNTSVIKTVTINVTNGAGIEDNTIADFSLAQNYPNPFNPETVIKFNIANAGKVKLSVYNVNGQAVSVLLNDNIKQGLHSVKFNATSLNSGVYFYKLETKFGTAIKKMMLIK